jgi:hypothetical protein
MKNSAISTILPTHNRAHLLKRAITSVLNQIHEYDELIIVDDGSTDNTETVVSEFIPRIRFYKTSPRGAGAARNFGLQNANNPLIAFIDSDDEWLANKIEIQRAFMVAMPEILFSFTNFSFCEAEKLGGTYKHYNLVSWSKDTRGWDQILGPGIPVSSLINLPSDVPDFRFHFGSMCKQELSANYINVNTLMVRRLEAGDALYFAEDTATYEDWECFGRLACAGKAAYLDTETACQYSHGGSRLTDAHVTECAQARVKILPRVWGANKNFIEQYPDLYHETLDAELLTLVDGLLVRGETDKARCALKQITGHTSWSRNLLAAFPGSITKNLISLRRLIKSRFVTPEKEH